MIREPIQARHARLTAITEDVLARARAYRTEKPTGAAAARRRSQAARAKNPKKEPAP